MRYHYNGFRPGDPSLSAPDEIAGGQKDHVDVAIIGCGPAGLTLAAQLAKIGGISVRIFDQKPGPLEVGQADGIACRSMEMFEALGFDERVRKEAYWVNETVFWRPGPDGTGLRRADRIQDVEDDLSHQPHVILNQARVHDFYLDLMVKSGLRLEPDYGRKLVGLKRIDGADHPIVASFECAETPGLQETISAQYLVGCDGARSTVRRSIGHTLKGEAARQLWGVMDVLAVTDFPDIRLKCAIQSATDGSVLIIPREGGFMVRLYIELDALVGEERAADRNVSPEMLADKARAILNPFAFEVKDVVWWSAYEIGQRLCDTFDDASEVTDPRIFIAGDACHTHSPKAGQGMNVAMADAFNLGWKLAAVLKGQAADALLRTYSEERQSKAQELIEFDRDMARLFSEKPKNEAEVAQFQRYFQKHGRYTAGVETTYAPSLIVSGTEHQDLAAGLIIGTRFHSAPVVRLADAKPMQISQALPADGRWRVVVFACRTDTGQVADPIGKLCSFLSKDFDGTWSRSAEGDHHQEPDFETLAVFQQRHQDLDLSKMPSLLLPKIGALGLTDYERIFTADHKTGADIFDLRGVDRAKGALVLVRPDQFIATVLPISAHDELLAFFSKLRAE